MMNSEIHVVGLGVASGMRLSLPAEQALRSAHTVIGSERQLELARGLVDCDSASLQVLPKLSELKSLIDDLPGNIAILASGDPLYYGIGRWLSRQFDASRLQFHPAVSSV